MAGPDLVLTDASDRFVELMLWQGQGRRQRAVRSLCGNLGETERGLSQDGGGEVGQRPHRRQPPVLACLARVSQGRAKRPV